MSRSGADLALLLLGGFRSLVRSATAELARLGYDDVQPGHEFAMRAILAGADDASALARRLSISKQAAAKTIALLELRGYVERRTDPDDARRRPIAVTDRGSAMLREGEAIFEDLRRRWESRIGAENLALIERNLAVLVADSAKATGHPASPSDDLESPP